MPTLLDTYGATNSTEFFVVATEAFFERLLAMPAKQSALYAQLAAFYRQDPASYSAIAAGCQQVVLKSIFEVLRRPY